jgi:hypothetical protein
MTGLSEIIRINKEAAIRGGTQQASAASLSKFDSDAQQAAQDAREHRESLIKPGETEEEQEVRRAADAQ